MPSPTRDFSDFSTWFLPRVSDCPMARSSVHLRGLSQFASYASHFPITEIVYLSKNRGRQLAMSSRSQPISFRGGLAQYSLLLVFGQVRDTPPHRIDPALIGAAEQHHWPIRPKHDSLCSEGCQNNLQIRIEIRFCPGLPTCFRDQARKLAKDIFPSCQLCKVLSPWGYHVLPYSGLRNVIENKYLVGMAVNE